MKMMKKLLLLVLSMALLCACAAAEESEADTLLLQELKEWAARYHSRALSSEPLNDPKNSLTSDGYAFIYDFATLYASEPKMNEDTVISAVVVTSPDEEGPRGTGIDDTTAVVLSAFYNENASLTGSREFATLYVIDLMPESLQWAQVQRDGQRVETIQYAVHDQLSTGGDGYSDAGVIYTMEDGTVSAIRVYGLDQRIAQREVYDVMHVVTGVAQSGDYAAVPFSYDGAALAKFSGEDLLFAGMDFSTVTPDEARLALGAPLEDLWMQDDGTGYIRTMTFPTCEMTFMTDEQQENPQVYMLLITEDGLEGPRAVRVGDSFAEVYNRFRNGEGSFDGASSEVLYGSEESGEFGVAEYGADASATLRYGLVLEDGSRIVLHMTFTTMELSEVMLYMAD